MFLFIFLDDELKRKKCGSRIDLQGHMKTFADYFESVCLSLSTFGITHSDRNAIVSILEKIIEKTNEVYENVFHVLKNDEAENIATKIKNHIHGEIQACNSRYKRDRMIMSSENFVQPYEISLGLRMDIDARKNSLKSVQSTFQYISILETLQMLFMNKDFNSLYIDYNEKLIHDEIENVYKTFNSGSIFNQNDFFRINPYALQIQLSVDDFEICHVFGNKSTVHKVRGVLLHIKNMPPQLLSMTSNIFVVALANANDMKEFSDGFDQILNLIVKEIKFLESEGLKISEDKIIKGTLVNFSFDNLGGNECFGFFLSFNKNHYCRMCTSTRTECQYQVHDNPTKHRKIADYNSYFERKEVAVEDFGYKKYCVLNNIDNFNILTNWSVDVMHDIHEGLIVFLLENIYKFVINNGILTEYELSSRILNFNYGILNTKNRPSRFTITRAGFGLTAAQLYCVMQCTPFILIDFKNQLASVWDSVESLLQIMQIIFSTSIPYHHIDRLETVLNTHLSSMIKNFQIKLKPKHHFSLHYPETIKRMGPIIYNWTMRSEAKNKELISYIRGSNCFINVSKTIAYQHQIQVTKTVYKTTANTDVNKVIKITRADEFFDILSLRFEANQVELIQNVTISNNYYSEGLIVLRDSLPYEIKRVIRVENECWILCRLIVVEQFDKFSNSIIVRRSKVEPELFKLNELTEKKTYEMFKIKDHLFVFACNLHFPNE